MGEHFLEDFWWLIFPVMGMMMAMFGQWGRHKRAQQRLEMLKSYIDQGKEPPPQMIELLKQGHRESHADKPPSVYIWVPVFLFAALCCGFILLGRQEINTGGDDSISYFFVAIIMAGLCLGNLVAALLLRRREQERTRSQ